MSDYFVEFDMDDDEAAVHFDSSSQEEWEVESPSSSLPLVKKFKISAFSRCVQWLKKSLRQPLLPGLREKSALALANHWMALGRVQEEMNAMGSSEMATVFKMEVAVHLKGHHLAEFLCWDGLHTLNGRGWPEVAQRLIVAVYQEMTRFDQTQLARQELSLRVKAFRDITKLLLNVVMTVHRLGLSETFKQPDLTGDNAVIYQYHRTQSERILCQGFCPMLVFPLVPVLRIDPKETRDMVEKCYPPNDSIRANEKRWSQQVSSQVRWNEDRGLILSEESAEYRRNSYDDCEEWSHLEDRSLVYRHFMLLQTIAQCSVNNSHPLVLVACFLALVDPFYSADRMTLDDPHRAPLVRSCQVDIYFYLSRALCWLHAAMDAPLACFHRAKKLVLAQKPPCLSEQARLALMQQEILVRYGHYHQARDVLTMWFGKLPSTSWMHEELVMIHTAGVFYATQEWILAAYITGMIHERCADLKITLCHEQHVKPMLKRSATQLLLLKSLLYRCLSDLTLRPQFTRDCRTALHIVELYIITVTKMLHQMKCMYVDDLHDIFQQLKNCSTLYSSLHLEPFNNPLPYSVANHVSWNALINNVTSNVKSGFQGYAMTDKPRLYADALFTVLMSLLIHSPPLPTGAKIIELTQLTLDMYRASTAGRHHRVGLLSRLLLYKTDYCKRYIYTITTGLPTDCQSTINKYHPGANKAGLSADETLTRDIRDYTESTMKHCFSEDERPNVSSPEMFCQHIKNCDSLTTAWIDAGLRGFRFASGV